MKEAYKLEESGMKIEDALAVAIVKYKQSIQLKISTCDIASGQKECELWAMFAQNDVKFWCKWNTGEQCKTLSIFQYATIYCMVCLSISFYG